MRDQLGLGDGDAVFFVAGDPEKFYKFAGEARTRIGAELKLVDESSSRSAWIVDFPFYEWNEEEKKIDFSHNPFSMPQGGLAALEAAKSDEDRSRSRRYQYDIVCNGFEIASGSIRNHEPETMVKAFEITGLTQAEVEERFGGLYRAFQYGAPPHGGMAAGIDRIVMLLCGAQEPARDHAVPDEPAGAGSADGRAVARCCPSSCASCTSAWSPERGRRRRKSSETLCEGLHDGPFGRGEHNEPPAQPRGERYRLRRRR